LTEVEKEDIEKAIERIIAGDYTVEERMMLDAVIYHGGKVFRRECALNDVVISRGALSRILHVKAFINDEFIDMFPGDGLIVSTPTGSTAYSLSAGGPVVEPDTGIMIITPICPHILYSRSIIVSSDRTVKAVVAEGYMHDAMVTVDGQEGYKLRGGDSITIKKSNDFVRLVKMRQMSFFSCLEIKSTIEAEDGRRMKYNRQARILDIIDKYPIETQDELVEKLRDNGMDVTQATISRDIRELRLTKVSTEEGKHRYSAITQSDISISERLMTIFQNPMCLPIMLQIS